LDDTASDELKNYFNLWRNDLAAQIYADNGRRYPYLGFDQFVDMSGFLPRSLLMILKYVTRWALFYDQNPFDSEGSGVSEDAQNAGVRDAARWFLEDAKPIGQEGENCDVAIRRLGSLLRMVRLSDKPSEVSVACFSSNFDGASEGAIRVVNDLVDHRLLLEIDGGRLSRNRGSVHHKYQIHPMVAPFFELPTSRRGELSLGPKEVAAIFDPTADEASFRRVAKSRADAMNAPFRAHSVEEALF
jgi:hypothetical protein